MSDHPSLKVVTQFVETEEGNIRIILRHASPSDPWLVLSPGQGDAAESLLVLLELAETHHLNIAVFDPPGHGLSDDPRTDYSPKSQLVVWQSVLQHLPVERAYIGGYSYGAYSATMCSGALGEQILGLILVEGGYLTMEQKRETLESETKKILEDMRAYRYDSWDEALEAIRSQSPTWSDFDTAQFHVSMVERNGAIVPRMTETTVRQMEQALADYSADVLDGVSCPILLLHSTLPPEKADMRTLGIDVFHARAPHAAIVPIPNCGHSIEEHLPFVMDQLAKFIHDVI